MMFCFVMFATLLTHFAKPYFANQAKNTKKHAFCQQVCWQNVMFQLDWQNMVLAKYERAQVCNNKKLLLNDDRTNIDKNLKKQNV